MHYVRVAEYYFDYFATREKLNAKARVRKYARSLDFIVNDILSHIADPEVREEFRQQVKKVDSVSFAAIMDKLLYLTDEQRETIELMLDEILKGETITIEKV